MEVNPDELNALSEYCSEFLVHAVDAEGKKGGADEKLAAILSEFDRCPVTYAGGVGSFEDLRRLDRACRGKLDVTIGSALDIYGGNMSYSGVIEYCRKK